MADAVSFIYLHRAGLFHSPLCCWLNPRFFICTLCPWRVLLSVHLYISILVLFSSRTESTSWQKLEDKKRWESHVKNVVREWKEGKKFKVRFILSHLMALFSFSLVHNAVQLSPFMWGNEKKKKDNRTDFDPYGAATGSWCGFTSRKLNLVWRTFTKDSELFVLSVKFFGIPTALSLHCPCKIPVPCLPLFVLPDVWEKREMFQSQGRARLLQKSGRSSKGKPWAMETAVSLGHCPWGWRRGERQRRAKVGQKQSKGGGKKGNGSRRVGIPKATKQKRNVSFNTAL